MALYDNKYWLLSHIRNSFISSDDTGMSELIMAGEEGLRKKLTESMDLYRDEEDSDDDDDLSHTSYDLQLDMDFGMRYRSNTAIRNEKLEQARKRKGRTRHVKWEMSRTPVPQERLNEMFVRKEVKAPDGNKPKSLFAAKFQKYTNLPTNPYMEYAKFDGSGQVDSIIKKYRIFLTMLPEKERNYPIPVSCIATAKIHELIGLILLKSSTTFEGYQWKPVANYGLYITEEDGEVDHDFPCLDYREVISKFGFVCLGLVEHADSSRSVSFNHTDSVLMSRSEDQLDRKLKEQARFDQEKQISTDLHLMDIHNKRMEAPLYKSYQVFLINKVKAKVEIYLGISGEKIEIDPIHQSSKFTLVKQKSVSHHIDSIAWCDLIDTKINRSTFKIIYNSSLSSSGDIAAGLASPCTPSASSSSIFKHYEFEADRTTTEDIVQKIRLILELRSSDTRKEYLISQEKKQSKRKTFNLNS